GGCGEDKYREEMETRAVERGLDNVTFLGWVDEEELFAQYKSADVYVLPSRADPWGISVVEAMKAGTPVILSDAVGAGRDLVDGKKTGYIFPSEDSTVLADYLADLLSDAEKRRKMGQEARTVATELMNYDRMASTIDSAVRRATSGE
ncbi:MAG: glycosyltransferase, partial [Halobacteriaceae archaeon]